MAPTMKTRCRSYRFEIALTFEKTANLCPTLLKDYSSLLTTTKAIMMIEIFDWQGSHFELVKTFHKFGHSKCLYLSGSSEFTSESQIECTNFYINIT
ncbi:hypothetical protein STEG23_023879, partial [Scotinomys teguina]